MFRLEEKIVNKIIKNIDVLAFIFITIVGISLRYVGRDFISGDMNWYLIQWFDQIKNSGGVLALSKQVGNYSILYQTLIALMTYIDFNPIYMYKILSVIFDFALAIASATLACNIKGNKKFSFNYNAVYGLVLCLPIFVFDSAWWGQCDSIYAFFIIVSLIMLFKDKYIYSFILLGIALSFKLQTVFIIPFYVMEYFKEKKFSILLFFVPVIVLIISGLPGVMMGRNLLSPIEIYLNQTTDYKSVSLVFNSFWNIVGDNYRWIKWLSIITTMLALVSIIYYFVKNNKYYFKNKLSIAILLTWTTILFLPNMHERYDYLLAVLLIIQVVLDHRFYTSVIISLLITTTTYSWSIFGWSQYNVGVTQLTTFIALFAYFLYIGTLLRSCN